MKENYNTSGAKKKETKSFANSFGTGLAAGMKATSMFGAVSGTAAIINAVVDASLEANMKDNKKKNSDPGAKDSSKEDVSVNEDAIVENDILAQVVNPALSSFLKEIAIAERINNSEIVEIEEYYEGSGKGEGGVGINLDSKTGKIGGSGESSKITKRVYKFTGLDGSIQRMADLLDKQESTEE